MCAFSCAFSFDKNKSYEVRLSMLRKTSLSPLEQIRSVHNIIVHPNYTDYKKDDIVLLTVMEPFQLNQWAAPICLPSSDYHPALGTNCTVVGWGGVNNEGLSRKLY